MTPKSRPSTFVYVFLFVLFGTGVAQCQVMNPWTQYLDQNRCAMTRGAFLAIAQSSPGFGWMLAPGNVTSDTFAEASAVLDRMRLTMAQTDTPLEASFKAHSCKVVIWQNAATQAQVIVPVGGHPGFGFMPNSPEMPCEEAALLLGTDPLGCTSFSLMSAAGTITMTPTGPVSLAGSITLATNPPVTVGPTGVFAGLGIGTTGSTTMPAGRYLGCFQDPNNPYDLDGLLDRSASNTPERCVSMCANAGFRFAGVQYGQSCLCGNTYGKFGTADNCNFTCTGNSTKICGGYNSNSVYATGR